MVWDDPEHMPRPGDIVLMCEDVLTTGGSVKKAEKVSVAIGAKPLPFLAAIVNRSNKPDVDGTLVVALITPAVLNWKPDECEACKAGSNAIKDPKDHWAELTA
jgi:orotate phosphoribosyltransferase